MIQLRNLNCKFTQEYCKFTQEYMCMYTCLSVNLVYFKVYVSYAKYIFIFKYGMEK